MKQFFILLSILITLTLQLFSTEPDTIWTQSANSRSWFTPDGTKTISTNGECLDVNDGHYLWRDGGPPNGKFTKDSLYFYNDAFQKFKISDGKNLDSEYVSPTFKTIPPVFRDTAGSWWIPRLGNLIIGDDDNTFYLTYEQYNFDDYTQKIVAVIALICKYDRSLDSIVAYKPILINGDTLVKYVPEYEIYGYSKASHTILLRFLKNNWITFRQINANTMDSVSEFKYDNDKWGGISEYKISYSGKYFGFVTRMAESNLGWINIYDLTTNSLYKRFLDGDSTTSTGTSHLAFSRNDSFIVTSGGKYLQIKTWNLHTGDLIHAYESKYSAANSLDVSPDNTKIIVAGGLTTLLRARWIPVTSVDDKEALILFPNPASDFIEIKQATNQPVAIYSVLGIKLLESEYKDKINVSWLPPGIYFVRLGDQVTKFVKL